MLRGIGVALGIAVLAAIVPGADGQLTSAGQVDAADQSSTAGAAVLL